MPRTDPIQIPIEILDGAVKGTRGLKDSLTAITVAIGTATAAAYTAKKAWDFLKEGAALELTADRFRNVATEAGYMSDVLLGKMKRASGGLMTDAELMASGLQIIELGLVDTEEGVVDLATSVSVLGLDMQQVILTLSNNSIMRLDALGLSVEKVQNRVKELNAEGFEGDAFDQAVIEGLTDRMEIYGDVAETTAGKLKKLEIAWANNVDGMKLMAVEAAETSGVLDDVIGSIMLEDAFRDGIISSEEYADAVFGLINPIELLADKQRMLSNANIHGRQMQNLYNQEVERGTSLHYAGRRAYNELSASYREGGEYIYEAADAQAELNKHTLIAGQAYSDLAVGIGNATQANRDRIDYLTSGGAVLNLMAEAVEGAIAAGDFGLADALNDELTKSDIDFQMEAGDIDATEAAARLVEELGITPAEADKIVEELESTLFEFTAITRMLKFGVEVDWSNLPPGVTPPTIGWGDSGIEITPPSDQWKDTSQDDVSPTDEFAAGTNGWLQVPGLTGQPRNITVHGGESMNVVPAGQSAGGNNIVNWYGDAIFTTSDEAMKFATSMQQRATRDAASMAAGAGYIGQ